MTIPANVNTAGRIIRSAFFNAGLIAEGKNPNGDQMARGLAVLNDLANFLQTKGLKLWLNQYRTITLVASTPSYTLGPSGTGTKGMRVLEAYYIDQNSLSRPLDMLSWAEWGALANRDDEGSITSVFVDKQQLNTIIWPWLVPDTTAALGTLQLLVQAPIGNSVSITDDMNFPQEWYLGLVWALADELAIGQPEAIIARCSQKRAKYLEDLEDWDVEDASTSFAPSSGGSSSAFS